MTITYPEITNLIMATDALRASLSSEKAEKLRVLDADLTLALWQLIPQAAQSNASFCRISCKNASISRFTAALLS